MPPYLLFLKEKEYLNPIANKDIIDSYISPSKVHVESSLLVYYKGIGYSVDSSLFDKYVQLEEFNGKLYIYCNICIKKFNLQNLNNQYLKPLYILKFY